MQLLKRPIKYLPYVMAFCIIIMGFQHINFIVTRQSPDMKKTTVKDDTTRAEQKSTEEAYDYNIISTRASKIQKICSEPQIKDLLGPFPSQHEQHLIVDDKTKILFCYVPKVACTNFKRVFLGLTGVVPPSAVDTLSGYDVHFTHVNKLKLIKDYSRHEIHKKMTSYRKFMFIRDPLERLVSAYRSKLIIHPNPDSRAVFLNKIQEFYTQYPVRGKQRELLKVLKRGTLSFKEFLYYLLDHLELEGQVNEHFVPIVTLCNPCAVKYNYIGSYETVNKDADFIFSQLGIPHHFPNRNDNYSSIETKDLVESYYEDLPPDLIHAIWEVFKKDYVILDIPIPAWLRKYTIS